MSRKLLTVVIATLLAVSPAAAGAQTDTTPVLVPDTTTFFLDNTGTACGANAIYVLATLATTGTPNCGYLGGLPLNEVFTQTGDTEFGVNTYSAKSEDARVTLDADQDVTGKITILHQGGTTGVGQLIVDLELKGRQGNTTKRIGATTVQRLIVGDIARSTLEFSLDIPGALDEAMLSGLSLDVKVRGFHANTGFTSTQGDSSFVLPILVEQTPAASANG